jgi:EAL domain-containing protein (putative c-di-GMP-specific phosphodiesterase class I)
VTSVARTLSPPQDLTELIAERSVRSVYQPIVDLPSRTVIGYEALARGPAGSSFESPGALFGEAERRGLTCQLDALCRERALEGALEAKLRPPFSLFVNVEPATLTTDEGLLPFAEEIRKGRVRVIAEFTERALAARPAEILQAVDWLRAHGCGVALDDVGLDRRSLALLPFLSPDVVKLDMSLIQQRRTTIETAQIVNAVAAEAERSGILIVAEGIETEEHLLRAEAMGATLGQGWYFGRPGDLPQHGPDDETPQAIHFHGRQTPRASTPFERVARQRDLRRGDKRLLLALSQQLEAEAEALGGETVVLSTFQEAVFFTEATRRRYIALGEQAGIVGVLGVGLEDEPAPGVRGAALHPADPLRGEWDVIVVSPRFCGAFVARDLGDDGADMARRFEFFVTYDRELVHSAAIPLMSRILPT